MKRVFGSLVFIFFATSIFAQSVVIPQSYIPPSPTAAALGKYGDIPVSTYTGIPDIKIPLIDTKELGFPIALSYHSNGFKTSDEASWVGLGWSGLVFKCGGCNYKIKKT